MEITEVYKKTLIYAALNSLQRCPNSLKTFPMAYEEFATSLYYFHLVKLTAKMVHQAVIGGAHLQNIPAISSETQTFIQGELKKLQVSDRQYVLNTLSWMGFDIWKELDDIAYHLATAFRHSPDTFGQYFTALGLDNLFQPETFSLFPELSQYVDHRPGKENAQSDEYFMNICLALAWYAETIGEEPLKMEKLLVLPITK